MQITGNVTNLQERDFNITIAMMYEFFFYQLNDGDVFRLL